MSVTLSVSDYLRDSGLAQQFGDISAKVAQFQQQLQQFIPAQSAADVKWQYQVPELGEGGACSLFGQLADEPYDLSVILGGQTAANEKALQKLSAIVAFYQQHSALDWFGIYQARSNVAGEPVLVKLAYYGAASRAEFPLSSEFAKISNNSTVGLTGKAKVINDVAAYLGTGGEYYTCDPKVQAEACLPLYNQSGKIIGIVDAEDFNKNVFTADAMALLVAVCLTVPAYLP
ncbi:GAF domain-containing protein [Rheinheimera aquimaris]|uniref:GAF domain-containing protein n=1 Tax=Rheinheimera aquimaris TaxID=412437 RepID=UPI000E96E19C|nr:GAF domain-containing protein [Rheinheimera aquimaris]HBN90841.1 histidine kinase [Rheinheimera sp.]